MILFPKIYSIIYINKLWNKSCLKNGKKYMEIFDKSTKQLREYINFDKSNLKLREIHATNLKKPIWTKFNKAFVSFWHQQHGFCFVFASTTWLLFCSCTNNMAFDFFQLQQYGCQRWLQLVRQGEVAWILKCQGHINQV